MSTIHHHIDDTSLASFAAGQLSYPYAIVVASHLAMCPSCRQTHASHMGVGGAVLDTLPEAEVSHDVKSGVMGMLDDTPADPPAARLAPALYPGPLSMFFGETGPKWRNIGLATKQSILWEGDEGSVRLLHIPAGKPVPEHGHSGPEYTLVLKGNYQANGEVFGVGDLEIADDDTDHTPTAGPEEPCICLAATNAPLRFRSRVVSMIQPLLKI
jgi:putative transcriptional regulator